MLESSADDTSALPSRRSLRETPTDPHPASVRVPVREHVPATISTPPAGSLRQPIPLKRRIAGVAAAAGVCGLVLAAALPALEGATVTDSEPAAAAQQRLFSEVSSDDLPASLTEITAVSTEETIRAAYDFRPEALVNYPFAKPVMLTDPFGYRTAPVEQFHDAQDFAAAAGTPIQAIADGVVLEAGFASDGCGFGLKLEHQIDGKEVTSRYCHMQDNSHSLEVGDIVKMGDPAGKVGATGMAFGAHLHMALRVNDKPVDPMPFLAKYHAMDRDKASKDKPSVDTPSDSTDSSADASGSTDADTTEAVPQQ